ncbi:hypothetical protein DCAR_0519315 [Daucus carota subsp. sativus]|uniref:Uncharacterized protein n=2 Tax=Daucus carota subsp. sativus TaxID=79200 RepID=A0A164XVV6_DAUCS|nr:hypothetical protein DCAR_0519315 [Daucus carota subsp. sativus]
MGVAGLTIYHVKSHLQMWIYFLMSKYRQANYLTESAADGSKEDNKISGDSMDSPPGLQINEALRMQMEVQKRLHEQLEVQRQLQMRIEAQARYLQKIIEEQEKLGSSLIAPEGPPGAEDKQFHPHSHQAADASTPSQSPQKKQKVNNEGSDRSAPSSAASEIVTHWSRNLYNYHSHFSGPSS